MPSYDMILNAFVTLFVTIDPIGLAPIFLALTTGMNRQQRYGIAIRGSLIALGCLVLFALVGAVVLETLGITIHAFRVAGGLLLFYIAFEMIFEKRQDRHEKSSEKLTLTKDQLASIAVFPLAIPLIGGPGAISAVIILSSKMGTTWAGQLILLSVITFVVILVVIAFILAEFIDKYIGKTGRMILTRLLGVLLAALAVQFVADGAMALFQAS